MLLSTPVLSPLMAAAIVKLLGTRAGLNAGVDALKVSEPRTGRRRAQHLSDLQRMTTRTFWLRRRSRLKPKRTHEPTERCTRY
jgi:hypothetical protein